MGTLAEVSARLRYKAQLLRFKAGRGVCRGVTHDSVSPRCTKKIMDNELQAIDSLIKNKGGDSNTGDKVDNGA
jgi:hypothetical protein